MNFGKKHSTVLMNLKKRYNKHALDTTELGKILGISRKGIVLRAKKGRNLPSFVIIGGTKHNRIVFPLNEVAKFLTGEKPNLEDLPSPLDTQGVILQGLKDRYKKNMLTARETAKELNITVGFLTYCAKRNLNVPAFKQVGFETKKITVRFPLNEVAKYISDVTYTKVYGCT